MYFPLSSFQISQRVFELTRSGSSADILQPDAVVSSGPGALEGRADIGNQTHFGKDYRSKSIPFELYKKRTSVFVRRGTFLDIVCDVLAEYKYVGPNHRADLVLACRYHTVSYLYTDYIDQHNLNRS